MRNLFTRSDRNLKIGGKTVRVRKITIAQWRELIDAIQTLPQLAISVLTAPIAERTAYFVVAVEQSIDDFVRISSILTGLDEEYIEENAAVDELVTYFTETAKVNNFAEMLKNVQGVLNLGVTKETVQDAS